MLLRVEEAAERLSLGRSTVYEAIRSGALKSVRINSSRRISVRALEEFIERLQQAEEIRV